MEDKIISDTYIREVAYRIEEDVINGYCYWLTSESDLIDTITEQNDLLIKAADRIEKLESGILKLLRKYRYK